MAFEVRRSPDWLARAVGLTVFLMGVGLLIVVFIWASRSLAAPAVGVKETVNWGRMGAQLGWELGRLFLLGFVASAIAGRGVQLYAVAGRAEAAARSPLE
jgi:hypothetical protein